MEDHRSTPTHLSAAQQDVLCGVSYLTPVPAAVMLLLPSTARSPKIRFHACQSILVNTLLMTAVFCLHLTAAVEQLLEGGNGVQLNWSARILCMAVWAIASLRLASGRQFRVPVVANLSERQANGPLFHRFASVSSENCVSNSSRPELKDAILSR